MEISRMRTVTQPGGAVLGLFLGNFEAFAENVRSNLKIIPIPE